MKIITKTENLIFFNWSCEINIIKLQLYVMINSTWSRILKDTEEFQRIHWRHLLRRFLTSQIRMFNKKQQQQTPPKTNKKKLSWNIAQTFTKQILCGKIDMEKIFWEHIKTSSDYFNVLFNKLVLYYSILIQKGLKFLNELPSFCSFGHHNHITWVRCHAVWI